MNTIIVYYSKNQIYVKIKVDPVRSFYRFRNILEGIEELKIYVKGTASLCHKLKFSNLIFFQPDGANLSQQTETRLKIE